MATDTNIDIKIDIAEILFNAMQTPLGVASLLIIVLGFVSIILFRKQKGWISLVAFAMLILGVLIGIKPVMGSYNVEKSKIEELKKVELERQRKITLVSECKTLGVAEKHSCNAYDKSGFHSTPGASCALSLKAGDGRFFAENKVKVLAESYRKITGASAGEAVKGTTSDVNGTKLVTSFSGSIGCTNSQGTGRTCQSTATIQAITYPNKCYEVYKELRE